MIEELYIIRDNKKYRLDLKSPSGITLKFQSNLFGDFSKIVASYSYTFKLPMTANNRRVLDNADDVRHNTILGRTKFEAEFYQDGLSLFDKANLYISTIGKEYQCVMTWGVVTGLDTLKDNDVSINELPSDIDDMTQYGYDGNREIANLDNTAMVLHPIYDSGVPAYYYDEPHGGSVRPRYSGWIAYKTGDDIDRWQSAYPMPVVPLYNIIQRINRKYGINIDFGSSFAYSQLGTYEPSTDNFDIIKRGVLPLVGRELTYRQQQVRKAKMTPNGYYTGDIYSMTRENVHEIEVNNWLKFGNYINDYDGDPFSQVKLVTQNGNNPELMGLGVAIWGIGAKIDGYICANFWDLTWNNGYPDEIPCLKAFQVQVVMNEQVYHNRNNTHFELKEVGSVEGEAIQKPGGSSYSYGDYPFYVFDFRAEYGKEQMNLSDLQQSYNAVRGYIVFAFDHTIHQIYDKTEWVITPDIDGSNSHTRKIDIISNLPDISCQALLKAIYYMLGAFPVLDEDGAIVPLFYSQLKENIESGNVIDWSSKVYSTIEKPEEVKFSVSNFAQINYFITKSDNVDDTQSENDEPETDIYDDGVGILRVNSTVIDRKKTVATVPFYAPYIRNELNVQYSTGNTMKCWYFEKNSIKYKDPKPAFGLIYLRPYDHDGSTGNYYSMSVWNGFKTITSNPSYNYLQEIIREPIVIKETLRLTNFDLAELDYSKPVYLGKYNSFFAIVSIQRDSKGKCKAELIKLP